MSTIDHGAADAARPTRRAFLSHVSALGIALPLAGSALAACSPNEPRKQASATSAPDTAGKTAAPVPLTPDAPYARYDPALPPRAAGTTAKIHFSTRDVKFPIDKDTVVAAWSFEGSIPGPIVHVRQGDTVEFTLTNHGTIPHSMDFHAARIDPKTAFRSIAPGESVSYTFRPKYAGAFLYHCGTQPVLMHIGMGMFGAIIVDPPTPLPPAREFVLVHSEFYLDTQQGVRVLSYDRMLTTLPDIVAFNGHPMQYMEEPIRVKLGERVRFYVVNAGPTVPCAFHVVGQQFDTVWLGAPPQNAIHGVQTFSVAAGGGMVFELLADVPGSFVFVNHEFGHGQKGAMGTLLVEA